jgi:uncharacterized protein
MTQTLSVEEHKKAREAIMMHVRKVVPYSLFVAVGTGLYMIFEIFGPITPKGLTSFQLMLLVKAVLGIWLGIRGFNQKIFKINPWIFTGHLVPFITVVIIILLSQYMVV